MCWVRLREDWLPAVAGLPWWGLKSKPYTAAQFSFFIRSSLKQVWLDLIKKPFHKAERF
jgi:hypothetical protein